MGLAIGLGPVHGAGSVEGLVALLLEGHFSGHERLARGDPARQVGVGKHQPRRRGDLQEHPHGRVLAAVRGAHQGTKLAADPQVHFTLRSGHAVGPPPLRQQGRLGPGAKDLVARRVDQAADGQFMLGGLAARGLESHRETPVYRCFQGFNSRTGRTSTLPTRAAGICPATWIASFKSLAWIR